MNAIQLHESRLKGTSSITLSAFAYGAKTDYHYDAGVFTVQPHLSPRPPEQVSAEHFGAVYQRYLELTDTPRALDFTPPSWVHPLQTLASPHVGRLIHYLETGN